MSGSAPEPPRRRGRPKARPDRVGAAEDMRRIGAFLDAQAAEAGLPSGSPDWLRAQDIEMQARALLEQEEGRNRRRTG